MNHPDKIYTRDFAGFFDLQDKPLGERSLLNVDDHPEAKEFADEVCRRWGCHADLLEALKSITLSMKAHPDCTEGSEFADMVNIAEKAIKKAKGL